MTKVIQIASVGENSTLNGTEVQVIDKTGESYKEYQILLKQYYFDVNKLNSDIERRFSLLLGQCSTAMN